jgi:hypothetical protein
MRRRLALLGRVIMRGFLFVLALLPGLACAEGLYVLPVKLLDTSKEALDQSEAHARRQRAFAESLAADLNGTLVSPEEVAAACPRETPACLMDLLAAKSADRGLFIVVQKSSTLILQIFTDLMDVKAQKLIAHRELNFRGDNDEGWRRAARFLGRQLRELD